MNKDNYHDCHCHLLPGLDDGPASLVDSVKMAHFLSKLGFTSVVCTPHLLKDTFANDVIKIRNAVTTLQEVLNSTSINLTLQPSAEYRLDEHLLTFLDDPMPIEENVVLIELPRYIQPVSLLDVVYTIIIEKKLKPMIAHPERHDIFDEMGQHNKFQGFIGSILANFSSENRKNTINEEQTTKNSLLNKLHDMGCLFQGNIGSFSGCYGERIRRRANYMLKAGLYDRFGTDAHSLEDLTRWTGKGIEILRQGKGGRYLDNMLRYSRVKDVVFT